VETLPLSTRVDFAQYTELTEFLTAATVPNGRYIKGSLVLDYSNADIQVEDANGNATPVTSIVDNNGDPVSTLEVNVLLEGRNALPVAPGIPKNLMLDFDLAQSNTVEFLGSDIKVMVDPVLIAEVDPQAPKLHRVRGPLKQVDVQNNSFELYIRPFFHRIAIGQRLFGSLKVITHDQTFYEIDGVGYQGAAGLAVLDTVPLLTGVIVRGDLKFAPLRFEAREVYAGSSVPGGNLDLVHGSVTARNGDVITVRGATIFRSSGAAVFHDNVSVTLDASTTVLKQTTVGTFDIQDISVGQRISVFGVITNDQVSDLQMSAVNGYARMRVSAVRGSVVSLPGEASYLALNLSAINGRNISLYDFTGTGTPGNDADPTAYEIDSGTLSLSGILLNDAIAVGGFPVRYATAPPDFTALTVVK